ncbi:MAG: hypothetical protein PSX36_13065 [bacterium]|nr:hypothetical protein [bacterium]
MNKVRFLSIVVIALLLSNALLIGFIVMRKPPGGPRDLIIKKLHLDAQQIKAYEPLIQWHQSEIKKTQDQMMSLKNQLYSGLISPAKLSVKDSLIKEINNLQVRMEYIHYKHFEDIHRLCRPDQEEAFKELSLEIARLFSPRPGKEMHK